MPYVLSWHIEKRVIHIQFHGDISVAEVISVGPAIAELVLEGELPLYLIVDSRHVTQYPTDLKKIVPGIKNNTDNGSKFERTVVISENRLVNFFSTMLAGVFKMSMHACKSPEEAETYLVHHDPELGALFAARHASAGQPISP